MARTRKLNSSEVSSVSSSAPKASTSSKAPKTKPSLSSAPLLANDSPELCSAAVFALTKFLSPSADRDFLKPGTYAVDLAIYGQVNKFAYQNSVNGILHVANDGGPVASSSAPYADLLQSALCAMSASERSAWMSRTKAGWAKSHAIPAPECSAEKASEVATETAAFLKEIRAAHKASKRGNVSFTPATIEVDGE